MSPRFPVSDHCDGARFFNPQGLSARSFWDLPKWWWQQLCGSATPWPKSAPAPAKVRLPDNIPAGQVAATFLGQATFLLQFAGCTVLTDPVFGSRAGPFGLLSRVLTLAHPFVLTSPVSSAVQRACQWLLPRCLYLLQRQ